MSCQPRISGRPTCPVREAHHHVEPVPVFLFLCIDRLQSAEYAVIALLCRVQFHQFFIAITGKYHDGARNLFTDAALEVF